MCFARTIRHSVLGLAALCIGVAPAPAQRVELSPFVGYRIGGSLSGYTTSASYDADGALSYGGVISFAPRRDAGVEFLFSHQATSASTSNTVAEIQGFDLNVNQWALGGFRNFGGSDRVKPFAAGYIGFTNFSSPDFTGSETLFAFAADLGLKAWTPSDRVALRLDARGYFTLVNSGTGAWCAGGNCIIAFSGDLFFQADFTAGVVIALGGRRGSQ